MVNSSASRKAPRRGRLAVRSRKKRSTLLSQERLNVPRSRSHRVPISVCLCPGSCNRLSFIHRRTSPAKEGRIIRNKLFFFGDWERTTRRLAASALRTVPTAALKNGDFNGTGTMVYDPLSSAAINGTGRSAFPGNLIPSTRIDPASAYRANLIPAPNQPVFPGNYLAVAGYEFRRDNVFTLRAAVGTTSFPKRFDRGYIESYNFTIQRDAGSGINFQAGYVGSRAIRTTQIQNTNAAGPGGGNAGRALYATFQRISGIRWFTPFNTAQYNGLLTQITRRFGGNMLGVSYTLSRATGYGDDTDSGLRWNWVPMLQRNKAVAGFDRTHNLQFFGNYAVPAGKGHKFASSGPMAIDFGGWQTNWIMSRYSGLPFTVGTSGTSVSAPGNTQTADQVLSNVAILGGYGVGQPYFNPLAFAAVTDVRFGTSGRNILRGPGVFNLDASVFRDFKIIEKMTMQFRAECFGATNTPQSGNPAATASSMIKNADGSVRALNGFTEINGASGERQFRFALKLTF